MSKSKKLIITGLVILIIGVLGSAISGVFAVPSVISDMRQLESESGRITEEVLDENVQNININSTTKIGIVDISIEKSTDKKVYISTINHDNLFNDNISQTHQIDKDSKSLNIDIKVNTPFYEIKNLKEMSWGFYKTFLGAFRHYDNNSNKIIIKVPDRVDLKIEGRNIRNIDIKKSDVLKDTLSLNTNTSNLILPKDNTLKNIDIKVDRYFEYETDKFKNAEKVSIECGNTFIVNDIQTENLEKIPSELNIKADNIEFQANKPLAKNTNIKSRVARVEMSFNKYSVYAKIIGARDGIIGENFSEEFLEKINNKSTYEGKVQNGQEGKFSLNINSDRVSLINSN